MKKSLFVLSLGLLCLPLFNVQAKSNWENYFTRDESKVIKKMVGKYVINNFENKDQSWRGIISSSSIKDGSITTDKLADNAVTAEKIFNGAIDAYKLANNSVTSDKILDGTITTDKLADNAVTGDKIRKKIYTGTLPGNDENASGAVSISDENDISFYVPIFVSEIDVDNPDIDIKYMEKHTATSSGGSAADKVAAFGGDFWEDETDSVLIQDGKVWLFYKSKENGVVDYYNDNEYKLIVTY